MALQLSAWQACQRKGVSEDASCLVAHSHTVVLILTTYDLKARVAILRALGASCRWSVAFRGAARDGHF